MKPSEIQDLIKFVAKSGVSEVEIEDKDFKIIIKTAAHKKGKMVVETPPVYQTQAPIATAPVQEVSAPVAPTTPVNGVENDAKYVIIKSPMIGTFYRKPSPDKDNFINVGDDLSTDTVVCMIEAMKLFNEIEAEITGKVVKILLDDGSPVEYDQPLFLVDPS